MESGNWRPNPPVAEAAAMDSADWRTQLQADSRQRIVNKIMDTLKRHLPFSGQEGLNELKKIAGRFEEKIYTAATSQSDYLRRISLKMLSMESKSQNAMSNSLPSNGGGGSSKPPDPGSGMQNQVQLQGQNLPIPLSTNQPQQRQQLLSQNIQNNMPPTGVQSSSGVPTVLPPVSNLSQTPISSVVGQNSNIQNISGVSQNVANGSIGQTVPSNMFANSQRQMQGRQQVHPQQQQQAPQNSQQYNMYQQQMMMKQKLHPGNMSHPLLMQQQQQQNLVQPNQLQSSQQPGMQTSSVVQPSQMQSAQHSSIQQNHQSSVQQSTQPMIQHHSQPVLRPPQQQQSVHQQQTPMGQQVMMAPQQQLIGQSNPGSIQQNQLIGQPNNVGEQRSLGQQNNLSSMQQQQQPQQFVGQQGISSLHHQQLGPQSVQGLQQQQPQLLGTQSGNSNMPTTNQHSMHMLQQSKVSLQQQTQQTAPNLLSNQGQQSQPQPGQQQLMSQIQSQPPQLQQQLGLQQQPNALQRDMQQRLQATSQPSGSLLQPQSVVDQQKQLYQSQRPHPETSSTSLDSTAQTGHAAGVDWQEEVYQKIKLMKEMYSQELNEMYQKIATKLQQQDSLPQPPKMDQFEKLKIFKTMLERIMHFLQTSKDSVTPSHKEKLSPYEKQIINFISTNRPRKPPGQLPPTHMHTMQQPQSQISQQSHDNQMNPQMQSMNLQGSVGTMQQNNMPTLQHSGMPSISGVTTAQQNMLNSLQSGSNLDSGQGNTMNSLQQVAMPQNSVSSSQQANMNSLSSQNGVNMLQSNINPLQSNSNMLQHQHLKQQQEQQMLPSQQLKQQIQHRQMQQLYKQQQLHQQAKQQLPAQLPAHQMQQLQQMNDVGDMKVRQGMGVKPGAFQQHLSSNQRLPYAHQQLKPGTSFPISPQMAASPQMPQSSPQVDQQNLLSLPKTGTPLQSANSPFMPSPSTPLAPSPMPGDSEKPIPSISSLSNTVNVGHQQATSGQAAAPSLAIGTPGISASPLLAEFTGPDGTHGTVLTTVTGKSSGTEQPLERLIRAVKSMSSKALSASVSDIASVASMTDRIAGSAPGNGSRAAVGEDLVAMTKCRLQARNFIIQDGMSGPRKIRRYTSAMPLNVVSSAGSVSDSFKQMIGAETSDLESTATSGIKRPRIEANHVLLEELREINQRLIDTVVDISDEDDDPTAAAAAAAEGGEGTIVKCSFNAVALSPSLKSQYASAQMSPIQPLRLLVPSNYPSCSPILLDKFPVDVSKEYEDMSAKAKSRFSISLRSLSQPMTLGDIARTWDVCARAVISEYAQQSGGGSFSSKYGSWENCLSAA